MVLSPADTILEMYPETAETTSILGVLVEVTNLAIRNEISLYQN